MQKITPFLWFDDNAEEAVKFYKKLKQAYDGNVGALALRLWQHPQRKVDIGDVLVWIRGAGRRTGRDEYEHRKNSAQKP